MINANMFRALRMGHDGLEAVLADKEKEIQQLKALMKEAIFHVRKSDSPVAGHLADEMAAACAEAN
jgi:hypothetical protein